MSDKIQLWHCHNTRSLRALWALEEMGLDYQLHPLPFPPRVFDKSYLSINPLGTVPFLKDGQASMTESSAICHYLAERYQKTEFLIDVGHAEYGNFLNWLYHSDATLTFPQTLYLRYALFESPERKQPQVADDYRVWFLARLRFLSEHLKNRDYLCDERFTVADIAVTYALYLGQLNDFSDDYEPQVQDYLKRMTAREAFVRSVALTEHLDLKSIF